jgi:hypothetical protein
VGISKFVLGMGGHTSWLVAYREEDEFSQNTRIEGIGRVRQLLFADYLSSLVVACILRSTLLDTARLKTCLQLQRRLSFAGHASYIAYELL